MRRWFVTGFVALGLGCGDDAEGSGGAGGGASSSQTSTAMSSSASTGGSSSTTTSSSAGGGGADLGVLHVFTTSIDAGGTVPLRAGLRLSDGTAVDVSDEVEITSLDGDLVAVAGRSLTGLAIGNARVEVRHEGITVEAPIRIRAWTVVDDLADAIWASGGLDGTVLAAGEGAAFLLPPGGTSWTPVGSIEAYGAAPLSGSRFLLPREEQVLDAAGQLSGATPPLDVGPYAEAIPFGGGRCAVAFEYEAPGLLKRWCDGISIEQLALPVVSEPNSLVVDDLGRVAFSADGLVFAETADGELATIEAPSTSAAQVVMTREGTGWAAWKTGPDFDDAPIAVVRFSAGAFEEPVDTDLVGREIQLAVLPDGRAVIAVEAAFQQTEIAVLPDGPSLPIDDTVTLFGGVGGLVHAYQYFRRAGGIGSLVLHVTDGDAWTMEEQACVPRSGLQLQAGDETFGVRLECEDREPFVLLYR